MSDVDRPSRARTRVLSPVKYDDRVHASVVAAIRAGASIGRAAAIAGVSRAAVFNWLASPAPELQAFAADVAKARAEYAEVLRAKVETAGDDDWKAAAWLLERQFPDEFGKVDRHEVAAAEPMRPEVRVATREDVEGVLMADATKH